MVPKLNTKAKIRIARMLYRAIVFARRLIGAPETVEVNRHGIRWRLDLREGIDLAIYLMGYFERETVRAYSRLLRPGDTALDIGANIGAHTLPLARCVASQGMVIAFEPTCYAYTKLRINVDINPTLATQIRSEQMMLVGSSETALSETIYSSWPLTRNLRALVHPKHQGMAMDTSGARAVPLDQYLMESGVGKVDFIKMDVDGHEREVLQGALDMLRRDRPTILMEIMPYGLEEHGTSLNELFSTLKSLNYLMFDLVGAPLPMDASLVNLIPTAGGINVICQCRE